jgi:hypothetical protein
MHTTCVLPGGLWDASGARHREAALTPLTGREEELLADRNLGAAAAVTTVLSRCVRRLGGLQPMTEAVARELLVGDRQFLLLKLRQLTFGDRVDVSVRCPWPDCGEPVDVDFLISQVPLKEAAVPARVQELALSPQAAADSGLPPQAARLCFRLPTGADQEALSPQLARNEAEALSALLARCVEQIGDDPASTESVQRLSPLARLEIERRMEETAPGVELTMEATCPQCGRSFAAPFDAQDFILGEARASRDLLMREVHYLAYHYHWSEHDILDMPRERRRRYIGILADEMERLNVATA